MVNYFIDSVSIVIISCSKSFKPDPLSLEEPSGIISLGLDTLTPKPPVGKPSGSGQVVFVVADYSYVFDKYIEVA